MNIHFGFWSHETHRPAEVFDCKTFLKLLVCLIPYLDKKEKGFYSISFTIGDDD